MNRVELFTGIRPTGDLTVANYLGAVRPMLELQERHRPLVFVADVHAMTDREPKVAAQFTHAVVADYLALGLDPDRCEIFVQSDILDEVAALTVLLARQMTVAELLRVPTLKDKLKGDARPETANALLFLYPVMMAADILLQRAEQVPVGEDQVAHLEVTRKLAREFNETYGELFPVPKVQQVKSIRILSLKGEGKMSKTTPEGAIFLTDDPKAAAKKVTRAQTAFEGEMSDSLKSLILIAKGLTDDHAEHAEVDRIIAEHQAGKAVMGTFKTLTAGIVERFLTAYQGKRAAILADHTKIEQLLARGGAVARANGRETLRLAKEAMYGSRP